MNRGTGSQSADGEHRSTIDKLSYHKIYRYHLQDARYQFLLTQDKRHVPQIHRPDGQWRAKDQKKLYVPIPHIMMVKTIIEVVMAARARDKSSGATFFREAVLIKSRSSTGQAIVQKSTDLTRKNCFRVFGKMGKNLSHLIDNLCIFLSVTL
jgi:hypothetical protein